MIGYAQFMPTKRVEQQVWSGVGDSRWVVRRGRLARSAGNPGKVPNLFQIVAEKLPRDSLSAVKKDVQRKGLRAYGVYVAHDSMGYARYIGRGDIFNRLKARFRAQPLELMYFSFYVVENQKHEKEIETLLIRAGGPQLHFNDRKRRIDIEVGNVRDFQAGTHFYERKKRRGVRPIKL